MIHRPTPPVLQSLRARVRQGATNTNEQHCTTNLLLQGTFCCLAEFAAFEGFARRLKLPFIRPHQDARGCRRYSGRLPTELDVRQFVAFGHGWRHGPPGRLTQLPASSWAHDELSRLLEIPRRLHYADELNAYRSDRDYGDHLRLGLRGRYLHSAVWYPHSARQSWRADHASPRVPELREPRSAGRDSFRHIGKFCRRAMV